MPNAFDFQERTGFPLAFDDRTISLADADQQIKSAIVNASDTLLDWETVRERVAASVHQVRRSVRVVRVFTDQPVYLYKGFALLPDPTKPDAPVDITGEWNVEMDCGAAGSGKPKAARCISLHRDHVQNRAAAALMLVARTIIVRGENATGGLSLVTLSENLSVPGSALVDLSARQDLAPEFGRGKKYTLFKKLDGSEAEEVDIDQEISFNNGVIPPASKFYWVAGDSGTGLPEPFADLQWQLDRARQYAPDYDWSQADPCAKAPDEKTCLTQREPRGYAGLDGGSWFGLTFRTTPIRARSLGQPGGPGGPGMDHVEDIQCGAPPVKYEHGCHVHNFGCNPDELSQPPCNPTAPPHPGDECVCHPESESCVETKCSVNYASENSADCVVTCGISELAKGQRGAQAGVGGRGGVVRISAVTRGELCGNEATLNDPTKAHLLDERCLDGENNDGLPGAGVDCDSDVCAVDPNVSVCPPTKQNPYATVSYKEFPSAEKLFAAIYEAMPKPSPNPEPEPELQLINPIIQPVLGATGPKRTLLDVGEGSFLQLAVDSTTAGVPSVEGKATAPAWAPAVPLSLPLSLIAKTGSVQPPAIMLPEPDGTTDDDVFGAAIEAAAADPSGGTEGKLKKTPFAGAKKKWAVYVKWVRTELVAANPSLAGCESQCQELKWVFVDRLARFLSMDAVRSAARSLAGVPVTDLQSAKALSGTDTSPLLVSILTPPGGQRPELILRSAGGGDGGLSVGDGGPALQVPSFHGTCVSTVLSQLDVTSFKNGPSGSPGVGGKGAWKACKGWHPTIPYVCYRPPLDDHCTRSDSVFGDQLACPDDRCRTLWTFPTLQQTELVPLWICPPGYQLTKLAASGLDTSPGPEVTVCPAKIQGEVGVECDAPEGTLGAYAFLMYPPEKSQVRPWSKYSWARATHGLHPLELRRRAGRGNTFFKRGHELGAAARYLSTLRYTSYNEGPICLTPPCSYCPEDPNDAATDKLKELCTLHGELETKLDRLVRHENYYGYPVNYVPPAALQTSEPLAKIDLVSLVKGEMAQAKEDRTFWMLYSKLLEEAFFDKSKATLKLNDEIALINTVTGTNGSLTQELALANQRIHDAALELDEIAEVIKQLEGMKTLVKTKSGSLSVLVKDLALGVALTAATGYGGAVAAAFGYSILKTGYDSGKEAEAKQNDAKPSADADQISEQKHGQLADNFDAKLDDMADDASDAALDKLGSGLDPVVQQLMNEMGLSEQSAGKTLGEVLLDAQILELGLDVYRAAAKLGQAFAERRIVVQKISEAKRRKAQLQAAVQTLGKIGPDGSWPPADVQYQIADLALLAAGTRVDRAGEYFHLLRRGIERDAVPIDPATGKSTLSAGESTFLLTNPICQGQNLSPGSLDVNLITLDCFEERTSYLQAYAGGIKKAINVLDMQDTTIPYSGWKLVADSDGQPAYSMLLDTKLDAAHRDFRATHAKQKLFDVTFFLETNDPAPAALPIHIRRPETNKDVYWIGQAPDASGTLSDVFVTFEVEKAIPAGPGDLLYYLLRRTDTYERDAYACNGLDENSPLSGQQELCRLSNLEPASLKKAYLEGLSLLGELEIQVPVGSLGGRVPVKLFADVRYTHEAVPLGK